MSKNNSLNSLDFIGKSYSTIEPTLNIDSHQTGHRNMFKSSFNPYQMAQIPYNPVRKIMPLKSTNINHWKKDLEALIKNQLKEKLR